MISIVDYGVGNISSVQNMLRKCDVKSNVVTTVEEIGLAEKIIFPGVGAFDTAMQRLNDLNLTKAIQDRAKAGIPLLGICLGAQLLLESSEEGALKGLGLIEGYCKKFDAKGIEPLRIPHMGWGDVHFEKHILSDFGDETPRFYFVHSYHFNCSREENILGTAYHGHAFTCAIVKDNVFGVQFHPEKSHKFGARLLSNFAKL